MQNWFAMYGWVFAVITMAAVIIPYLMRKSDLLTSWNLFLVGSANFVGYAAVQSAHGVYKYSSYLNETYARAMGGITVFYVVIFAVYYLGKRFPSRLAGRTWRKWPPVGGPAVGLIVGISVLITLWSLFAPNIQGLGQIVIMLGPAASTIGIVLVLKLLVDGKLPPISLVILLGLTLLALVSAFSTGTSRRFLLSLLATFPIALYWMRYRWISPVKTMVVLAIVVPISGLALGAYSAIRYSYRPGEASLDVAIARVKQLPEAMLDGRGLDQVFGSDSIECTLWIIQHYGHDLPLRPFHTLNFVISNPIPRVFWPDKPEGAGSIMPRDLHYWRLGSSNLGVGIVGACFFEGGYFFVIFYAVLFGMAMRYCDEILVRQPNNPYFLGMLGAASGQILAFSRGDVGLFTLLIIASILSMGIIKALGRRLFGTGLVYPTDAERQALLLAEQQRQEMFHPEMMADFRH